MPQATKSVVAVDHLGRVTNLTDESDNPAPSHRYQFIAWVAGEPTFYGNSRLHGTRTEIANQLETTPADWDPEVDGPFSLDPPLAEICNAVRNGHEHYANGPFGIRDQGCVLDGSVVNQPILLWALIDEGPEALEAFRKGPSPKA